MRISVKLCLYEIFLKFGPRWWLRRYDHEFKSRATAAYIERWQENVQRFSCFSIKMFFFKNGPFPASFSLFLSFQYSKQMFNINKFLPMTGFESRTSCIGSNHSTNWATQPLPNSIKIFNHTPRRHRVHPARAVVPLREALRFVSHCCRFSLKSDPVGFVLNRNQYF